MLGLKKSLFTGLVAVSLLGSYAFADPHPDEPQQQEVQEPAEQAEVLMPPTAEAATEAEANTTPQVEETAPQSEVEGKFYVIPPAGANKSAVELLLLNKHLTKVVADLNQVLNPKADIGLTFADCGEENASYDPSNKTITFCNELMSKMATQAAEKDQDAAAFDGAIYFVLYHEIGHALVDALDLPITGREEDVADQFSIWNMLTDYQRGAESEVAMLNAVNGAITFFGDAQDVAEADLSDEHSLNGQRLNNVLCWAYGSGISQFSVIAENNMLPANRLQRCASEYSRMNNGMATLLAPYSK